MPSIEVSGLSKGFGANKVLKDLSFKVEDGDYVVFLGPSGCGKTTLLKTLAGLYAPDSGRILIDGRDVTNLPPEERGIGFFFQHYFLFPHMSVADNVGFSLAVRGEEKDAAKKTVDEYLSLVGLSEWGERLPHELSGGMQQRVALARALASGAKLLLLDEPLNALDAKIASMLRGELRELAEKRKLTVLHVTPNQEEGMELADKMVLINHGRILESGSDIESYMKPKSPYSAYFIGESNFMMAKRTGPHTLEYRHHTFNVSSEVLDDDVILAIRPEKIRFESHERNTLAGTIDEVSFLGKTIRYDVNRNGRIIHVETSKHPDLKVGDRVTLYFPPDDLMVFPASQLVDDEITVI